MRVVVDTNIVFSAILNTNSTIATVLIKPGKRVNFYSTEQLFSEIKDHKEKLKTLSNLAAFSLARLPWVGCN